MSEPNTWRGLEFYSHLLSILNDVPLMLNHCLGILKSKKINSCNYLQIYLFISMSKLKMMKDIKNSIDQILSKSGINTSLELLEKQETEHILLKSLKNKPQVLAAVREILAQDHQASPPVKGEKERKAKELECLIEKNFYLQEQKKQVFAELQEKRLKLFTEVNSL